MKNGKRKIRTPWRTLVLRTGGDTKRKRGPGKFSLSKRSSSSTKSTPTSGLLKNRWRKK